MLIKGLDFHQAFSEFTLVDTEPGGCGKRRLNHGDGVSEKLIGT